VERMWALDGLRGLCALSVVIYHAFSWERVADLSSAGAYSVHCFFILSALTLTVVYKDSFSRALNASELTLFYRKRLARLIPLLLIVAIVNLTYSLFTEYEAADISKGLLTASGTFALAVPAVASNSVGAWSLAIELMFYIIFPIICLFLPGQSIRNIVISVLLCLFIQIIYVDLVFQAYGSSYWNYYIMPLSFVGFFSIGCALGILKRIPMKHGYVGLIIVMVVVWASCFIETDRGSLLAMPYGPLAACALGLGVYCIYCWPAPKLFIPALRFLGETSYSVYLLHPIVYSLLKRTLPVDTDFRVFLATFVVSSVIVAYFSFRMVERPARNFLTMTVYRPVSY